METLAKVQAAVKNFDFTAKASGGIINVYNWEGRLAATIMDGEVKPQYKGSRNLCGKPAMAAIIAAL